MGILSVSGESWGAGNRSQPRLSAIPVAKHLGWRRRSRADKNSTQWYFPAQSNANQTARRDRQTMRSRMLVARGKLPHRRTIEN